MAWTIARWAAVILRQPLPDGSSFATARIDPDTVVEVGDTVEPKLGPQPDTGERSAGQALAACRRPVNLKGPRWAS